MQLKRWAGYLPNLAFNFENLFAENEAAPIRGFKVYNEECGWYNIWE